MQWITHREHAESDRTDQGATNDAVTGVTGPLTPDEVVLRALGERRVRRDGAPWVLSNMVTSTDGATTVAGLSGALGGEADRIMLGTLRAVADVVIAGAGTVRAERYRLPGIPRGVAREWRERNGLAPRPRLCIVSRRGSLDGLEPLLDSLPPEPVDEPSLRPILAIPDEAPEPGDHRFDVVRLGTGGVDVRRLVAHLGSLGAKTLLCEGGPRLLGDFTQADAIDEWNFTIAAAVVGGSAPRATVGADEVVRRIRLDRTLVHTDGTLLLRYVRGEPPRTPSGSATTEFPV